LHAKVKKWNKNYSLQDAIHGGRPALLENVGEQLDSGLESILLRHTFISNGMECILLGDSIVEYNSNFKLYIVTDYRNPHFPPGISLFESGDANPVMTFPTKKLFIDRTAALLNSKLSDQEYGEGNQPLVLVPANLWIKYSEC